MTAKRTRARVPTKSRRGEPADVYGALADPTRRQLLDLLTHGEQHVNGLVPAFRMTRSAVSQHLAILREAGLVQERRVGRERRYRLQARPLKHVYQWLARYERFWDKALDKLGHTLDES